MPNFSKVKLVGVVFAASLLALTACGDSEVTDQVETTSPSIDAGLLDSSWPVMVTRAASDEGLVLDGLVGEPGWQAYYGRDYESALASFKETPILAARIHSEIAAVYRNALSVQTNSIVETYKPEEQREGDPLESTYLLGVSYSLAGNMELATELLGQMSGSSVEELAQNDSKWSQFVSSGESANLDSVPDLANLAEVEVGGVPAPTISAPHYRLPETVGDRTVAASDPTVLAQLAYWHESAALMAGGNAAIHASVWGSSGSSGGEATLDDLFLSPWMSSADLGFVSDIGTEIALDDLFASHPGSLLAVVLEGCVSEGSVDFECVQAQASVLRSEILARMIETAGVESADYRDLSQLAEVGVVRAAIRLADMVGDEQASGLLRIGALEAERPPTLDPIFQLAMAAWDVGNRNPRRASELLHVHESRLVGLDSARYSLDALNLRVSRDAGAGLPMH